MMNTPLFLVLCDGTHCIVGRRCELVAIKMKLICMKITAAQAQKETVKISHLMKSPYCVRKVVSFDPHQARSDTKL